MTDTQDPVRVITEFLQKVADGLYEGTIDVTALNDDKRENSETDYHLIYNGHVIEVNDDHTIRVNTTQLSADRWVLNLHDRLWGACVERSVMQAADEEAAARAKREAEEAQVRHASYIALAEKLRQ